MSTENTNKPQQPAPQQPEKKVNKEALEASKSAHKSAINNNQIITKDENSSNP